MRCILRTEITYFNSKAFFFLTSSNNILRLCFAIFHACAVVCARFTAVINNILKASESHNAAYSYWGLCKSRSAGIPFCKQVKPFYVLFVAIEYQDSSSSIKLNWIIKTKTKKNAQYVDKAGHAHALVLQLMTYVFQSTICAIKSYS